MEKILLLFLAPLLLTSCGGGAEENLPANYVDGGSDDYVQVIEAKPTAKSDTTSEQGETESVTVESDDSPTSDAITKNETDNLDVAAIQEKNAEAQLKLEAAEAKIKLLQEELAKKQESKAVAQDKKHLALMRSALLNSKQPEYPFRNCGRLATFIRSGWFKGFENALARRQIRFSDGFLETSDLFGGCYSDKGKMAFFLGAERNDDQSLYLLKYDLNTKTLAPALALNSTEGVFISQFGKRDGAFIRFQSDGGSIYRYYYDANMLASEE